MKKIYFDMGEELANPCYDRIFKAIFTNDTPESQAALKGLLSAIIGRDLTIIAIATNEPPVESMDERQIRYDISCKFDDGELCNIEMTLNPDSCEVARIEYYTSKLHISQNIKGKGKGYKNLKHAYQISLLVNAPIIPDSEFIHHFQYYDIEREISLEGKTHIITIELSKLDKIIHKAVEEMNALERWALFFRYTPDKDKRQLINEIIKKEEGIAMAGQVLLTVSKEEREQARLLSEYKYELDLQSKLADAMQEGLAQGIAKGQEETQFEIVKEMLLDGDTIEKIARITRLAPEKIQQIRDQL